MPPRRAAQELGRRAAAEAQPKGLAEVDDAGLRDGCAYAHLRSGAWSVRREARARRRPEREVTAGRVPERGDMAKVERRVHVGEEVDRGGDVEERGRPAAARRRPDPAVLDVPRGVPVRGEV